MKTWGIVPAKGFERAKTRLSGVLAPGSRASLARALLEGVLEALARTPRISAIAVVTDSDRVARCAVEHGALALRDPPGAALAATIDSALAVAARRGADAALVCMADLGHPSPAELDRVAAALTAADAVAVPDLSGRGTSVLGLRPPPAIATCFGHDDSLSRHRAACARGGLRFVALRSDELAFDVDTPADLARLASTSASHLAPTTSHEGACGRALMRT
ncbi:MAG: 2-phospho-L-lactate guanylyltransferase [Kofleriaceae bacterium]